MFSLSDGCCGEYDDHYPAWVMLGILEANILFGFWIFWLATLLPTMVGMGLMTADILQGTAHFNVRKPYYLLLVALVVILYVREREQRILFA